MLSSDLAKIQQVRDLVAAAQSAQVKLAEFSQQQVDRIVAAMAEAGRRSAEMLARMAAGETGMGRVESKTAKNLFSVNEVYEHIRDMKTTGVLRHEVDRGYYEVAEPMGLVAAIIPSTNPTSTTLFKALIAIKARNCVIFAPHPRAAKCIYESAKIMYEAALAAGAPAGCIGCISEPTMEATQELMKHPETRLILATGGPGLVKAAYASGKPAFGVGAGNTPTVIERSADISHAVRCIVESQMFDYGTVCSSEQSVIVDAPIYEEVVAEFRKHRAHVLNEEEIGKISPVAIVNRLMNPKIVGQPAHRIAAMAGITLAEDTTVLLAPLEGIGDEYPLSYEKLAPILSLFRADNWQHACEISLQLLELGGKGHTMGIHSTNRDVIMELALLNPLSRIIVNAPTTQGGIGLATFLAPSMTLGCGTFGNNITSDNISANHLLNIKRVAAIDKDFPLWDDGRLVDSSNYNWDITEEITPLPPLSANSSHSFSRQSGWPKIPEPATNVPAPSDKKRGWPFNAIQ